MIPCPSCKRDVYTRLDILYVPLQGRVQCRFCGHAAQLDVLSRWLFLAILALTMPGMLLYGNIFYSGHLFVVSMVMIFIAWCVLASLCFPILTLEQVPGAGLNRSQGTMMLAVLLIAAMLLDGFIASRIEADAQRDQKASHAERR